MQFRSLVRFLGLLVVSFAFLGCEDDDVALPPGFSYDGGVLTLPDGGKVIVDAAAFPDATLPPIDSGIDASNPVPEGGVDAGPDADVPPVDAGPPPDAGSCTGKPNGASCGNPTSSICDRGDTCLNGDCVPNFVAAGTACGSAVSTACSEPDTCDGNGACSARNKPAGTPCGSTTASACTQPDSCDGNGVCLTNNAVDGTSCGDPGASQCDSADSCINGVCVTNVQPNGTPCGNPGADACTAPDSCQGGVCVANHSIDGTICGDPTETECNHADSCVLGACVANLANDGAACGDPTANECNGADSCLAGACVPNLANNGTPCGDPTSTTCNAADTCQAGACAPNLANNGTPCGDPTVTACNLADSCQAGVCAPNLVNDGTPCGNVEPSACSAADSCLAGVCNPNHLLAGTPCGNPKANDCDGADSCDGNGACLGNVAPQGTACYDCRSGGGLCSTCNSDANCDESGSCFVNSTTILSPLDGSNNLAGNMFDVSVQSTVTITGFEQHILGEGTTPYEIYYRPGTHVGFETNANAWTRIFAGNVTALSTGTITPITFSAAVTIPAGSTYSFYMTVATADGNVNGYHNGQAVGNAVVTDGTVTIREGVGKGYPFGSTFSPRVWEGRLTYHAIEQLSTPLNGTGLADGLMFDVGAAPDDRRVQSMDVELSQGVHDVTVYFKRGTHVGQTQATLWELLGSAQVTSAGVGTLTSVPFSEVQIPGNSTVAFYVTTGAGGGVSYATGTSVGTVAATSTGMTLREGVSVQGLFGTTTATRVFRGRLSADICSGPILF